MNVHARACDVDVRMRKVARHMYARGAAAASRELQRAEKKWQKNEFFRVKSQLIVRL